MAAWRQKRGKKEIVEIVYSGGEHGTFKFDGEGDEMTLAEVKQDHEACGSMSRRHELKAQGKYELYLLHRKEEKALNELARIGAVRAAIVANKMGVK